MLNWVMALAIFGLCSQAYDRLHGTAVSQVTPERVLVGSRGLYSILGFGRSTNFSGSGVRYLGNVGDPYGSNIIEVPATKANGYKYVVRFEG